MNENIKKISRPAITSTLMVMTSLIIVIRLDGLVSECIDTMGLTHILLLNDQSLRVLSYSYKRILHQ